MALIWELRKATTKKFNTQDSEVLYALYHLEGKSKLEPIAAKYKALFNKSISEDSLIRSLETLFIYKVLEQTQEGDIQIVERITSVRV